MRFFFIRPSRWPVAILALLLIAACAATSGPTAPPPAAVPVEDTVAPAPPTPVPATPSAVPSLAPTAVPTYRAGRDTTITTVPDLLIAGVVWSDFGVVEARETLKRDTPVSLERVLEVGEGWYALEVSVLGAEPATHRGWLEQSRRSASTTIAFPVIRRDGSELRLGDPDVRALPIVTVEGVIQEALGGLPIELDETFVAEGVERCRASRPRDPYATSARFAAADAAAARGRGYVLAVESRQIDGTISQQQGHRYVGLAQDVAAQFAPDVDILVCVAERADDAAGYCITDVGGPRFCTELDVDIEATSYAAIAWVVDARTGEQLAGPWLEPAPMLPETLHITSMPGIPVGETRAFRPTDELRSHIEQLLRQP